ncbi:heavy-metal-associated domain-containing protein [Sandaracinobacteroides saxicola]|uniref:Heavy-metal-associated domain-containing protein n=1 Tax=Sandaracinobacteroides saxicola TaxID=2759707 RepID=A0A7G5IKM7_9SPHN|nr:heavy metal-associated domain-containing protein [Sandaracinobacteroides saxicola]QMW23919.1 heavy-metal-associated domain-containing protein [Sandaracinobacteroides saxicola]
MKSMMISLALLMVVPMAAAPTAAAEAVAGAQMVTLKVKGLVCDFCARSIEAMMKKRADVATVHVDLDKGEVHLRLKPGATLDDATARRLMLDAGFTVAAIERVPA